MNVIEHMLRGLFLLLVLQAAASGATAETSMRARPESPGAVDIQVALGFSNTFRLGRWTPVTVTLSNRGADLVGVLDVEAPDGDEVQGSLFTTTYQRRVELPGESRKRFRFTVFLESLSRPVEVRVSSGDRVVARKSIDLRRRFTTARLILVLSRDADLDYLNDNREGSLRVLYPHLDRLPDRWQGYDGVVAIVLHGISLERLDTRQFDAIRKWVARGGILAVSGGADYSLLRTPRLSELIPATPVGLLQVDDRAAMSAAFHSTPVDPVPFHVNRVAELAGRVTHGTPEIPLVIEQDRGRGRVLYLTFDVTHDPFQRWIGMRQLWLDLLQLPPAESLTSHLVAKPSESPILDFAKTSAMAFPGRVTVSLFLALYLALLITAYRQPFGHRPGRWVVPLVAWISPLVFAPVAYLVFGPLLFPKSANAVVASVIEPYELGPYADLKLHVGFYANYRTEMRLDYQGVEPVFRPVHRGARLPPRPVDWLHQELPQGAVQPASRASYVLHVLEGEDVIPFDVRVQVEVNKGVLALQVRNHSGHAFGDAWLVFRGRAYALGPIAEDADWPRTFDPKTQGIVFGDAPWRSVLRKRAGALSAEPIASHRALAHMLLERRGRPNPPGDQALLMGIVPSPLRMSGSSAAWSRRELAVVLIKLPVAIPTRRERLR